MLPLYTMGYKLVIVLTNNYFKTSLVKNFIWFSVTTWSVFVIIYNVFYYFILFLCINPKLQKLRFFMIFRSENALLRTYRNYLRPKSWQFRVYENKCEFKYYLQHYHENNVYELRASACFKLSAFCLYPLYILYNVLVIDIVPEQSEKDYWYIIEYGWTDHHTAE